MEGLINLVAASFVRNGIECPAGDPKGTPWIRAAEPASSTDLPEQGFRKPEAEVAT